MIIKFIGPGTVLIHKNDLKYLSQGATSKHSDYGFDKPVVVTRTYKSRYSSKLCFEVMGIYSDGVHSRTSGITLDQIKEYYKIYPKQLTELHIKLKRKAMEYKPISLQESKEIMQDLFSKAKNMAKDLTYPEDHASNCDCVFCRPDLYCIGCNNYLPETGWKDMEYCAECQVDNADMYKD